MLRSSLRWAAPLAAVVALLDVAPRPAQAEELDGETRFKSVGMQGNPLAFVIGRYSLDLEYLPSPHHALHATPLYYYALPGTDDQLTGFGAEAGYRFYSGEHGPHGLFAGLSLLIAELEYVHGNPKGVVGDHADDTLYVQFGGALDVGYQVIALGNFSAGAGAGVQYTVNSVNPRFEYGSHSWHDLLYGWGLRPRVLVQIGAAF